MKLDSKTALVTGGGSGIGRAAAESLAQEGCRVVIAGRGKERLQEVVDAWSGPGNMAFRTADVSQRADVQSLVEWSTRHLGRIDLLVHSAGINVAPRRMADLDPDDWDQVLAVNATGAYNCLVAVLPQMRQRRDGHIINIVSIAGKRASELGGVAYNAAKFAQTALGLSTSLEHRDLGIRVTNVYPGEVDTPILDDRPVPVTDEHRARILKPQDFGHMVVWLASLPARVHVSELTIKPTTQAYV